MFPLLVVLFLAVPIAELYVLIQVGQGIGILETLALLVVISIVGAWLAKREGLSVLRRMRAALNAGRVPGTELLDGFLILLAAALMLTPGFLTDAAAILLLLPPVRAAVRQVLRRRFVRRIGIL